MNVRIVAINSGKAGDFLDSYILSDDGITRLIGVRKASADCRNWANLIGIATKDYHANETLYEGPCGESLGLRIARTMAFGRSYGPDTNASAEGATPAQSWRDRPPML